ncbi:hypothetical protein SARC_04115 [Sphaeroforma arctica JP610]|uniref:D-lactate dehydrogenase (cytochrome) n=1 Tax=Sphaeroforma arctica JP610 TaxID=667725 RepID=A0A0L0G3N2_9EUKA|nr:hypothetical protein SARC_04115 [Sphaeroforma arctica JP610]KNC83655.1 hypothetical protein SARC_04115 [Sphaeroforma arctica JP610]|eukprot:XP_014157557.1 hypothetical protein SARC_04115 [Sphaeroforma arctica JP610]
MTGNVDNNVGDVIPTKPQVIHNKITATDYERLLAACANDKARVLGGANDDLWAAEKYKHSHDASYHEEAAPDLVVYPLTTEETSAIMAICHERGLPVTASGARTGLEGGCIPVQGGVTLDLSRMNKILEHHEADAQVTVQCGIMKKDMQEFASEKGMFFAMDPGSEASIGGYASTGASGTLCTAKYGTMRDNVIRMRVVLPDGRTFWTRQRAIKSSAGYDLNHLFMGTEGSLGIITELCILLHPKPASMVGAVAVFPTLRHAAKAVIKIHHSRPSSLARCELLNTIAIRSVNNLFPQQYEETPTIFFEFHGTDEGTTAIAHAKYIESLCDDATSYRLAETEEEREKLWEARRGCYFASFKVYS